MKFKAETKNGDVHFKLNEKHLDTELASKLKAEFLILCTEEIKNFYIDLSDIEFCDSSGLSALLIAQRHTTKTDGKTYLINCQDSLKKLLKISQLDRVFVLKDKVKSLNHK
jgi:anti-sigma B factor antagonist